MDSSLSFPRPGRILTGPDAWRGADLRNGDAWLRHWTPAEIRELETALQCARATGLDLARIGTAEFPLGSLESRLAAVRRQLLNGRGFALLRGLDVGSDTLADVAAIFWGIGQRFGRALVQNARGHLLGHVRDLGRDAADPEARIYQTRERQGFHTDSADIVALLCLAPARQGGRSALVSAASLHNVLFEEEPELLQELFLPFCTDHRGEHAPGAAPWFTAPIFSWFERELSVLYQRRYIESAQRFPAVPRLRAEQIAALDAFDAAADREDLKLEIAMQPGDILLVHNHQMLHDRTAFVDFEAPERRRHLLRLWTSPAEGRRLPPCFLERFHALAPGQRGGILLAEGEPVLTLEA